MKHASVHLMEIKLKCSTFWPTVFPGNFINENCEMEMMATPRWIFYEICIISNIKRCPVHFGASVSISKTINE